MAERNLNLDIIRGIAAFSVVANHVLSHFEGFAGSMIGNINFSLQNPLFMMVAGFALVYSKPVTDVKACINYIKKRTILLLLPWLVWSLLLFVLCAKQSFVEHVSYTLYHMEGAYWFLFAMWLMSIFYAISALLCRRLIQSKVKYITTVSINSMFMMACLCVIAYLTVGINFLAIKLATYYYPFYLFGWIVAEVMKHDWSEDIRNVFGAFVCIAFIAYMILIAKYDMPALPDKMIVIRVLTSILGCVVLFQTVFSWKINSNSIVMKLFSFGGQYSLEMYVVHYVMMRFLSPSNTPITAINGFLEFFGYYVVVLAITALLIEVINTNKTSRFILFGKTK